MQSLSIFRYSWGMKKTNASDLENIHWMMKPIIMWVKLNFDNGRIMNLRFSGTFEGVMAYLYAVDKIWSYLEAIID